MQITMTVESLELRWVRHADSQVLRLYSGVNR